MRCSDKKKNMVGTGMRRAGKLLPGCVYGFPIIPQKIKKQGTRPCFYKNERVVELFQKM